MVRRAARARFGPGHVELLGLGEQSLLGLTVGGELRVAFGVDRVAGDEEGVLSGLEPLPQRLVDVLGRPAGGLPLREQIAESGCGGRPLGRTGQFLGPHTQSLLGLP